MSDPAVELVRAPRPYWHDTQQFAEFVRWLVDTNRCRDWYEPVSKPHKWESEHVEYLREQELERLADEEDAWQELERRSAL